MLHDEIYYGANFDDSYVCLATYPKIELQLNFDTFLRTHKLSALLYLIHACSDRFEYIQELNGMDSYLRFRIQSPFQRLHCTNRRKASLNHRIPDQTNIRYQQNRIKN